MEIRKLQPTKKPLDAVMTCILIVALVVLGYAVGAGWAGAAGVVVVAVSLTISRIQRSN